MSRQIHTYTELKQQIHEDLRTQHPEWVDPGGKCPKCDEHEARLKELLEAVARSESNAEEGERALAKESNDPSSP